MCMEQVSGPPRHWHLYSCPLSLCLDAYGGVVNVGHHGLVDDHVQCMHGCLRAVP